MAMRKFEFIIWLATGATVRVRIEAVDNFSAHQIVKAQYPTAKQIMFDREIYS